MTLPPGLREEWDMRMWTWSGGREVGSGEGWVERERTVDGGPD